jgi:hypothetical protein
MKKRTVGRIAALLNGLQGELPRKPIRRSSQNSNSTRLGE